MDRRTISRMAIAPIVAGVVSMTGCSKDDAAGGPSFPSAGAEAGAFTLNAAGTSAGTSAGGTGGFGGSVTINMNEGMEGRVEVLDHGKVDASFTAHTMTGNMGSKGETISADTTIAVLATEPAAGTLYLVANDSRLYKSDGDGTLSEPTERVSGITVNDGITLTVGLNATGASTASLTFLYDIVNNGTITAADAAAKKGNLTLTAMNYIGGANSKIVATGSTATIVGGGSVTITTDEMISNKGTIDSSGFTDTAATPVQGGAAGTISLSAGTELDNTGAITASGGAGNGTTGAGRLGGNAGNVTLASTLGDMRNSAAIKSLGGNGNTTPGTSGTITLKVNAGGVGDVVNSGDLSVTGGNSTAANAEMGGNIVLTGVGGDVKNSGNLMANGGNAQAGFTSGAGGSITITSDDGAFESNAGNILVSGNLNVSEGTVVAGAGSSANTAGSITIDGNTGSYRPAPQLVALWGYTDINLNGGDGETGGDGGTLTITTTTNDKAIAVGSDIVWRTSGKIVNEANINTKGGNTTATTGTFNGGAGGSVTISADNATNVVGDSETVTNKGDITTSAGANFAAPGTVSSGTVILNATSGVTNSGIITTSGAADNDTTTLGRGNNGNTVTLASSAGTVNNSAAINTVGGNGKLRGGTGRSVTMYAVNVANSGNIATDGGDADAAVASSIGGSAGRINFTAKASVSDSGTHTQTGGTGVTPGYDSLVKTIEAH